MTDTMTTMAAAVVSTVMPPVTSDDQLDGTGLKSGGVVEGGRVRQSVH